MGELLQLSQGTKSYGYRNLFVNATFAVNEGEHIGVIGPNGAGKTTLFRILNGGETLDSGRVVRSRQLRSGYLAQEVDRRDAEALETFLTKATTRPMWEIKQLGRQLGISDEMFTASVTSLSGGFWMRCKLLALMADEPNLMLLDEPTNYLDLETLLVLEDFLINYKGAFLLISHDREFLRRTTDHIVEIESGEITKFCGNIDDYFEQKAQLREILARQAQNVENRRRQILQFADRFRAKATKARQVQSKLKLMEKIMPVELRALPVTVRIALPSPPATVKEHIKLTDACLGYDHHIVLANINFTLFRGEHVAVVGLNGAGKTTLLKALSGQLPLISGALVQGNNITLGYYAQHVGEALNVDDTVLTAIGRNAHPTVNRQDLLDLAGALMFSGDEIEKKIKVLSGGERSRVALGQVLAARPACLILDEPTNHLDFHTVEALTQALTDYAGTLIAVSHDRGFIGRIATKIVEINDGKVYTYPGTYAEYVWSLQHGVLATRADTTCSQQLAVITPQCQEASAQSVANKINHKSLCKNLEREIKQINKELQLVEKRLEVNRQELEQMNVTLLTLTGNNAAELAKKMTLLQHEIDGCEEIWLTLSEKEGQIRDKLANLRAD